MHFLLRVSVAGLCGARDAFAKNFAGFVGAILRGKEAAELIVRGYIFRMSGDELREVRLGGGKILFIHAFHRQAIARKRVSRILLHKLFEHLPAFAGCWGRVHTWRIIRGRFAHANSG